MDICRLEIISENREQSMHGRHTQMLILLTEHVVSFPMGAENR